MQKMTKCIYCNADITYSEDAEYLVCMYCGRQMEVPGYKEEQEVKNLETLLEKEAARQAEKQREKVVKLYADAAALQRDGRFEEASASYKEILELEPDSAEAHWQRLLCRYGVEYVREPATGAYFPTIFHLIEDSILEDADYKETIRCARNPAMQEYYQREAGQIDGILREYIEIYREQARYDVFISVKQGDEQGNPTKDSQIALDLYYMLTNDYGLKVFNSRVSLQQYAGSKFEPHIMAALLSAKVMLVVGTKPENLMSPWVRNEWRRFRWLSKNRPEKRMLLPCVSGMSVTELPNEMGYVQALDFSDVNWKESLIHAVCGTAAQDGTEPKEQSMADLAALAAEKLKGKDWKGADALLEKMLEKDSEEAGKRGAYFSKLLCEYRSSNLAELRGQSKPLESSIFYSQAIAYGDETLGRELKACNREIIQKGIAGDVWKKILERSGDLKQTGMGAELAPLFREAYEENGEAMEEYKASFNAYMEQCSSKELSPVTEKITKLRSTIADLEKNVMKTKKQLESRTKELEGTKHRIEKPGSAKSFTLGIWNLFTLVMWLFIGVMAIYSVVEEEAYGAIACGLFFAVWLVLLKLTGKGRRAAKERAKEKQQYMLSGKSERAKELEYEVAKLKTSIESQTKSIENNRKTKEKLEEEAARIREKYPHF